MLKILRHLSKKDILIIVAIALLVVVQVWLEIEIPNFMREITRSITTPYESIVMGDILRSGGIMAGLAFGSLLAAIITVWLSSNLGADFAAKLRLALFTKVEKFSFTEVNHFSPNSLLTRTTTDVNRVQMLLGIGTRLFVRAPVMAIWALTRIASQNWYFLVLVGGAFVILAGLVSFLIIIALPKFRRVQVLIDNINRLTRENLSGIRVVRAYNAQAFQKEKFEVANRDITKTQLFVERSWQILPPGMTLITSRLALGITLLTGFLIYSATDIDIAGELFADMIAFNQYAMMAIMAFVLMVFVFTQLPRAVVSAKRILEVLDAPLSIVDGAGANPVASKIGEVEFKDVSFRYPDATESVLSGISFTAKKGQTVAFIGSTGSGKSTLISLAPRFYEATGGDIFVSGNNIKDYKLDELNAQIGFVAQRAVIFSGTIRDNIAFGEMGNKLTDSDILEVAEVAQAKEFIDSKENGLQSGTAQGGTNLSGGQKQRVSIARALAKKPPILIFDDSFSALDYKTDRVLRNALNKEFSDVTKLIVAQRIGTIMDADKIVVLDKGKAVGVGTHKELMESCEVYRDIALSQLSSEELGM